jgi:DNA end-binding protein Ku
MRPLWKGAISFGLVNIPVGLYPAIRQKPTVDLVMLRDSDLSRIRYKKITENDGKEVSKEHIGKGSEYGKGHYVVLTDEDFQRVQVKSNQLVDIREFVELAEIEPRFFDEPYFLAPEKAGAKAYNLLRLVLEETGLVGIAKVVIRPPREHLAAVKPLDGALMLETMHFADELREPAELDIPKAEPGSKEMSMANTLVKAMTGKWEPEKYHDEYREALLKLIEQKAKSGAKALPALKGQKAAPGKIIDLASLLKQSLSQSGKAQKKAARHRTAHKKAA